MIIIEVVVEKSGLLSLLGLNDPDVSVVTAIISLISDTDLIRSQNNKLSFGAGGCVVLARSLPRFDSVMQDSRDRPNLSRESITTRNDERAHLSSSTYKYTRTLISTNKDDLYIYKSDV